MALYHFRDHVPAVGGWLTPALSQGFLAVDLFFILSGVVIHMNYSALFGRIGAAGLRKFAVARFARVVPLHVFMSFLFLANPLAIVLFSHQADYSERYPLADFPINLLLVNNWGLTEHPLTWNVPSWSISTEFAAYLLFPLMALLTLRHVRRPAAALALAVLPLAALAACFAVAGAPTIGHDIARLGIYRCLLQFLAGVGIGQLLKLAGGPPPPLQAGLLALAGGLFAAVGFGLGPDYLLCPPAFAALIYAITSPTGPVSRFLGSRPLVFLGEISYATYLCHYFVKDWANFLIVRPGIPDIAVLAAFLTVTLVLSVILNRAVELPSREWIKRGAGRWAAPKKPAAAEPESLAERR